MGKYAIYNIESITTNGGIIAVVVETSDLVVTAPNYNTHPTETVQPNGPKIR